jgi:hypothetical protein
MQAVINHYGVLGVILWSAAFLAILLGLFFWLRSERRSFSKQDKTGSWLWLRIWYLPILIITAITVVLPSYAVSGMEALVYFYIALFTLGPLVWFGLHVLIGKCLTPAFTRSESLALAMSGLGFIIVSALLINALQSPIFSAVHGLNERLISQSPSAPLPFYAETVKHFKVGEGNLYTQTLSAAPNVQIQRIDVLIGGDWHDSGTYMHSYYCRDGQNIHLAWQPGQPIYPMKFYWQGGDGQRFQSEYQAPLASDALAEPFEIAWRDDGFDLPVPLHRSVVQLNWRADNDNFSSLNSLQIGEDFTNDCVMRGYKRIDWQKEGPVMQVMLILHGKSSETTLRHTMARPESSD